MPWHGMVVNIDFIMHTQMRIHAHTHTLISHSYTHIHTRRYTRPFVRTSTRLVHIFYIYDIYVTYMSLNEAVTYMSLHICHCIYITAYMSLHICHCIYVTAYMSLHICHCIYVTAYMSLHIFHNIYVTASFIRVIFLIHVCDMNELSIWLGFPR